MTPAPPTPQPTPVDEAVAAALRGELIVIPTDTVYGIAARPDEPSATAALFAAKGRPRDLTLPVLVDGLVAARRLATFDAAAETLAETFWPGPLTIVLPRTGASRGWDLGGHPDTVGIRVPRHPLALAVLERSGPLAVSSANRSGEPEATTCDELTRAFGDRVSVYLCEETPLEGNASTVVDLAHVPPRLIRSGDVAPEVRAVLGAAGRPLLDSMFPA
jgi:tRNA threonylcarbamoyl adenosine modification protein (Sua5/YciO/YrdC/YwlC family)